LQRKNEVKAQDVGWITVEGNIYLLRIWECY